MPIRRGEHPPYEGDGEAEQGRLLDPNEVFEAKQKILDEMRKKDISQIANQASVKELTAAIQTVFDNLTEVLNLNKKKEQGKISKIVKDFNRDIKKLKGQIERLKKEAVQRKEALQRELAAVGDLETELLSAEGLSDEKQKEISDGVGELRTVLEKLSSDHPDFQDILKTARATKDKLRVAIKTKEASAATADKKTAEQEAEESAMAKRLEEVQAEIDRLLGILSGRTEPEAERWKRLLNSYATGLNNVYKLEKIEGVARKVSQVEEEIKQAVTKPADTVQVAEIKTVDKADVADKTDKAGEHKPDEKKVIETIGEHDVKVEFPSIEAELIFDTERCVLRNKKGREIPLEISELGDENKRCTISRKGNAHVFTYGKGYRLELYPTPKGDIGLAAYMGRKKPVKNWAHTFAGLEEVIAEFRQEVARSETTRLASGEAEPTGESKIEYPHLFKFKFDKDGQTLHGKEGGSISLAIPDLPACTMTPAQPKVGQSRIAFKYDAIRHFVLEYRVKATKGRSEPEHIVEFIGFPKEGVKQQPKSIRDFVGLEEAVRNFKIAALETSPAPASEPTPPEPAAPVPTPGPSQAPRVERNKDQMSLDSFGDYDKARNVFIIAGEEVLMTVKKLSGPKFDRKGKGFSLKYDDDENLTCAVIEKGGKWFFEDPRFPGSQDEIDSPETLKKYITGFLRYVTPAEIVSAPSPSIVEPSTPPSVPPLDRGEPKSSPIEAVAPATPDKLTAAGATFGADAIRAAGDVKDIKPIDKLTAKEHEQIWKDLFGRFYAVKKVVDSFTADPNKNIIAKGLLEQWNDLYEEGRLLRRMYNSEMDMWMMRPQTKKVGVKFATSSDKPEAFTLRDFNTQRVDCERALSRLVNAVKDRLGIEVAMPEKRGRGKPVDERDKQFSALIESLEVFPAAADTEKSEFAVAQTATDVEHYFNALIELLKFRSASKRDVEISAEASDHLNALRDILTGKKEEDEDRGVRGFFAEQKMYEKSKSEANKKRIETMLQQFNAHFPAILKEVGVRFDELNPSIERRREFSEKALQNNIVDLKKGKFKIDNQEVNLTVPSIGFCLYEREADGSSMFTYGNGAYLRINYRGGELQFDIKTGDEKTEHKGQKQSRDQLINLITTFRDEVMAQAKTEKSAGAAKPGEQTPDKVKPKVGPPPIPPDARPAAKPEPAPAAATPDKAPVAPDAGEIYILPRGMSQEQFESLSKEDKEKAMKREHKMSMIDYWNAPCSNEKEAEHKRELLLRVYQTTEWFKEVKPDAKLAKDAGVTFPEREAAVAKYKTVDDKNFAEPRPDTPVTELRPHNLGSFDNVHKEHNLIGKEIIDCKIDGLPEPKVVTNDVGTRIQTQYYGPDCWFEWEVQTRPFVKYTHRAKGPGGEFTSSVDITEDRLKEKFEQFKKDVEKARVAEAVAKGPAKKSAATPPPPIPAPARREAAPVALVVPEEKKPEVPVERVGRWKKWWQGIGLALGIGVAPIAGVGYATREFMKEPSRVSASKESKTEPGREKMVLKAEVKKWKFDLIKQYAITEDADQRAETGDLFNKIDQVVEDYSPQELQELFGGKRFNQNDIFKVIERVKKLTPEQGLLLKHLNNQTDVLKSVPINNVGLPNMRTAILVKEGYAKAAILLDDNNKPHFFSIEGNYFDVENGKLVAIDQQSSKVRPVG